MNITQALQKLGTKLSNLLPGQDPPGLGYRAHPENAIKYMSRYFYVDTEFRSTVLDIRKMDALDPRVKKVHSRTARTAIKGGLRLQIPSGNKRIIRLWNDFEKRLQLHRKEKLESDCRGLVMEGNLPIQWILNDEDVVVAGVRMPSETIVPLVSEPGTVINPKQAYQQFDFLTGMAKVTFPLWQLNLIRLSPLNYDDFGCLGRPYLDSCRTTWKKLTMSEEDLVLRRKMRAPLRLAHTLENAKKEELEKYRMDVEERQDQGITTDYYLNKKGGVQAIQGDSNLSDIADVVHLLDTFFSGTPGPKGLFGYGGDLARDILEKLTADFYDEIDSLQDTLSFAYELGFRLDLLLRGINPDYYDFSIIFAERRTDTPNQRADLALKYQAIGAAKQMVWESAGLNPDEVKQQLKAEEAEIDAYPAPTQITPKQEQPNVNVTPGNAPMGESATTISTRTTNG